MKLEWSSDPGFHWSFAYLLWWSTTLPAQKNMKHHYNYSQTSGKRPPKNAKTNQWSQNTGGGRLQELNKRRPSFSEKKSMHIYTNYGR